MKRPLAALLALLLAAPGAALAAPDPAQVGILTDRVVAEVGTTPITASEVALEEAIRARVRRSPDQPVFGRLLTEARDPLEAVLFRAVVRQRLELREPGPEDRRAEERFAAFLSTFTDPADATEFRKSWGLARGDLLVWFKGSVALDAAVEEAVASNLRITEDEERAYYEEKRDLMFPGRPFGEVQDFVATQVYNLKFEEAYQAWRRRVRASVPIRYVGR